MVYLNICANFVSLDSSQMVPWPMFFFVFFLQYWSLWGNFHVIAHRSAWWPAVQQPDGKFWLDGIESHHTVPCADFEP